jgi:hypothetical protein
MFSLDSHSSKPWESLERVHEGFPLYLRRPLGLDFEALSPRFPIRLTVTHALSFRRFDGLPQATYNRGLEQFDSDVVSYFTKGGEGQVVLVETFGGERNYYFYVSSSVDAGVVLADLRARFPGYILEVATNVDPNWAFITWYAKEHLGEA